MAKQIPPREYGDLDVGDNATIRLGDTIWHVANLNVTLPVELVQAVRTAIESKHSNERGFLLKSRQNRPRCHPRRGKDHVKTLRELPSGTHTTRKTSTRQHRAEEDGHVADGKVADQTALELWDLLPVAHRWLSRLVRSPSTSEQQSQPRASMSAHMRAEGTEPNATTNRQRAVMLLDRGIIPAGLAAWLIRRSVSYEDLLAFLATLRPDELLLVLLLLLLVGSFRYQVEAKLCRPPATHLWTLEDAYGYSFEVSTDILIDFSVFRQYLEAYYTQTGRSTAVAFIKAQRFHLVLTSRSGPIIGEENWQAAANLIKPGRKAINSILANTNKKACIRCDGPLSVSSVNELHCKTCDTFHRDCSTFEPRRDKVDKGMVASDSRSGSRENPAKGSKSHTARLAPINGQNADTGINEFLVIGDIKHIDLRLTPSAARAGRSASMEQGHTAATKNLQHIREIAEAISDLRQVLQARCRGFEQIVPFDISNGFILVHRAFGVARIEGRPMPFVYNTRSRMSYTFESTLEELGFPCHKSRAGEYITTVSGNRMKTVGSSRIIFSDTHTPERHFQALFLVVSRETDQDGSDRSYHFVLGRKLAHFLERCSWIWKHNSATVSGMTNYLEEAYLYM